MMREVALFKIAQNTREPRVINMSISKGDSWHGNRGERLFGGLYFLDDFKCHSLTIENIFSVRGPDPVICLVMCDSAGASGVACYHVKASIS